MDCMEGMKDFPDKFFDLAIVDPPYGDGNLKGRNTKLNKEWNLKPNNEYFNELFRISDEQIIWGGNYFGLPKNKHFIVWDKKQYMNNQFARCEYAWSSMDYNADIYDCFYNSEERIHPTQKPVALYKWLLKNYAKPDFKIIDTHVGSGSSIIAFIDFGCDWIGFEIDKDYHKAATERIERHKQQLKLY